MLSVLFCSGSLLGFAHHCEVQVAQHQGGILCPNKQIICSLKFSLANLLLAIWSRGGTLNNWPSNPGVKLQFQTLKTTRPFLS